MGYMRKRSAEAMGSWWSWITGETPTPSTDPADPATVVANPASVPSSGGNVGACVAPLVYNEFYESCVNPCPKGQAYDKNGICASAGMSDMQMLGIGVGVVAAYLLLFGKKRGRR